MGVGGGEPAAGKHKVSVHQMILFMSTGIQAGRGSWEGRSVLIKYWSWLDINHTICKHIAPGLRSTIHFEYISLMA